jgi:hypothetical protein
MGTVRTVCTRAIGRISKAPRMVVSLLSVQVAALLVLAATAAYPASASSTQLVMKSPSAAADALVTGAPAPTSDPARKYAANAARIAVATHAQHVAHEKYLAKLQAQAAAAAAARLAAAKAAKAAASASAAAKAAATASPSPSSSPSPTPFPTSSGSSGGSGCSDPSGQLTASQVEMVWVCAGGPAWAESAAVRVTVCESSMNTHAYNPSGATGLFQIKGSVVPGDLYDAHVNALNAVSKFEASGNTWAQWTCKP